MITVPGYSRKRLLQPLHGFGVEVVGGLVEQEQVGLLEQGHAQGHPPPLAAGKLADRGIVGRQHQGVGGDVQQAIQLPAVAGVDFLL